MSYSSICFYEFVCVDSHAVGLGRKRLRPSMAHRVSSHSKTPRSHGPLILCFGLNLDHQWFHVLNSYKHHLTNLFILIPKAFKHTIKSPTVTTPSGSPCLIWYISIIDINSRILLLSISLMCSASLVFLSPLLFRLKPKDRPTNGFSVWSSKKSWLFSRSLRPFKRS